MRRPPWTGWDTNRRIVTINDSAAVVPFRSGQALEPHNRHSLIAGWQIAVRRPPAQSMLNYLRGDRSNEGVGTTNFRVRSHMLGDIVYSGAVPVGAPNQPYDDAGNPGYSAFATSNKSRTPMVYVGGNDGMVHAFDDSNTGRRRQGNLGVRSRRRCSPTAIRTTRPTRRRPSSSSGH